MGGLPQRFARHHGDRHCQVDRAQPRLHGNGEPYVGAMVDIVGHAGAFPAELPANMARDFYEWPALLQLYRTASVVAVSLFPNGYAAGIQAMLEAIACERPIVVTRTEGLADYLDRPDLITIVPANDPVALAAAIRAKLADPEGAARQAHAARAHYGPRIDSEVYCRIIADRLRALAATRTAQ